MVSSPSTTAATAPASASVANEANAITTPQAPLKTKLHGRAFYESIGSPKYIVAPMVDQSEFAWRMLTRSFLPVEEQHKLLCYTPMFHARLFTEAPKYRDSHYQPIRGPLTENSPRPGSPDHVPFLDGNPKFDRSVFVQFCANDPNYLLSAAKLVAPYCDAVDLNLGCPQGIAKRGQYGSFLQENQELIFKLINTLHKELDIPVTAKIRILDTKEATLKYAQNVLSAGASILTVHGRRREQKGHQTGLADWEYIRYLRENLPKETVIFANGNILQYSDLEKCLEATGADGVMSAEGNLSDPGLFAQPPPVGEEGREYWRSKDRSRGGWRVDAVMRRYMDIIYKYVLEQEPPVRRPLFVPGDDVAWLEEPPTASTTTETTTQDSNDEPPRKKHKSANGTASAPSTTLTPTDPTNPHLHPKNIQSSPNLVSMQPHCFHLLRHFVTQHTDVRDMLARARNGADIAKYEAILSQVERKVAQGLLEYERTSGASFDVDVLEALHKETEEFKDDPESSAKARRENKRPWWVVQPIIRPLPKEALAKGALQLSKKDLKAQKAKEEEEARQKVAGGKVAAFAEAVTEAAKAVAPSVVGDEAEKKEETKTAEKEAPVPVQGGNGAETAVESLETTTSYPKSELVSG